MYSPRGSSYSSLPNAHNRRARHLVALPILGTGGGGGRGYYGHIIRGELEELYVAAEAYGFDIAFVAFEAAAFAAAQQIRREMVKNDTRDCFPGLSNDLRKSAAGNLDATLD